MQSPARGHIHPAADENLDEFSANPTTLHRIYLYHSRKPSLLLAIFPIFSLDDKGKFSSWGKTNQTKFISAGVWAGLGFSAEYSSPFEIQGKDAPLQSAALAIEVKGCNLPLDNPGGTSGDPCYPSASSEAHWLLHGSSYV